MKPGSFLRIHRWIALAFAPLLLVQAATGATLLFREPIARLIDPAAMIRQTGALLHPAPVSAMTQAAQRRFPGMRVTRLFLPASRDGTAFAQLAAPSGETGYAAIDPGNGRVLAAGPVWRFPTEAALQIHYRLLTGWPGTAVVALNGLALLLIGASGVSHWWPGRGLVLASLKVRRNLPARIRLRLYHRSTGAIVSLLVLFSAATGMLLAIADLSSGPAAPAKASPVALTGARIDAAMALVHERFPGSAARDIRFAPDGTLTVNLFAPHSGPRAVDIVRIDAAAPALTSVLKAGDNPALWLKVLPLHTGDRFGLPGRLLLLAEALALIFLCISGPLQWWRGRHTRSGARK